MVPGVHPNLPQGAGETPGLWHGSSSRMTGSSHHLSPSLPSHLRDGHTQHEMLLQVLLLVPMIFQDGFSLIGAKPGALVSITTLLSPEDNSMRK